MPSNECRPCGRRPPAVTLAYYDLGRMGSSYKGIRILLCPDCTRRTGKVAELGITIRDGRLHCSGTVATREGVWDC